MASCIRAINRGAVDVIAVVQNDGTIVANPFHIKLCHSGDFMTKVKVQVNGTAVPTNMRLNETGHAVFVQPAAVEDDHHGTTASPAAAPAAATGGLLSETFDQLWMDSYQQVYNEKDDVEIDDATKTKGFSKNRELFTDITPEASSDTLLCWNLMPGKNVLHFQTNDDDVMSCSLYLWKWSDKIIISDIDGTITKSDIRGQAMALMKKDWTQTGVASLYKSISENGYRFLYLTARAIAQFSITKAYLKSVVQDGKRLPAGPLLLSDSSLFNAFKREVIARRPDEFKIDCLARVAKLFPSSSAPFYAGFGNKHTDVVTYKQFISQCSRIFTVNSKEELINEDGMTNSSYCKLKEQVEEMFPKVTTKK